MQVFSHFRVTGKTQFPVKLHDVIGRKHIEYTVHQFHFYESGF